MNTWKFFKSKLSRKPLAMFLIALSLISAIVITQSPFIALGMWGDGPVHVDPIHPPNVTPPPYEPPAGGFTWSVPVRFGMDGNGDSMVDTYWNSASMTYDQNYIYPNGWPADFFGCQTEGDDTFYGETTNTYTWVVDGVTFPSENRCHWTHTFPAQGTYTVRLYVTDPDGNVFPAGKDPAYFEQQVTIKDYFIVSIGDSLTSGEGNPDIRIGALYNWPIWIETTPVVWQDKRCHRSVYSGPPMAAIALELADPHTSVTFISFACSGASLNTPNYDSNDPAKHLGTGILGPYRGAETDVPFSAAYENYIPAQMDQLRSALNAPAGQSPRQIDALIISAGGNDIHFGEVATKCIWDDNCWDNSWIKEDPHSNTEYTPRALMLRALKQYTWPDGTPNNPPYNLPDNYDQLAGQINALNPAPAHVYLNQYMDQTRDDNRNYCDMLDDILPFHSVTPSEAQVASYFTGKLNDVIRDVADKYKDNHWQLVDGITTYEVDPLVTPGTEGLFVNGPDGKGHGYCATDNWITTAEESEIIQGPLNWRPGTRGTLHPTSTGQRIYKERLLRYLLPDLMPERPQDPPHFSLSFSSGGLTDVPGTNGWYIGSQDSSNYLHNEVVVQAVVTSTGTLNGATISVNDLNDCSMSGVACTITPSADMKQVTMNVDITASGTYHLLFNAQDNKQQISFTEQEIKVDLDNPVFSENFPSYTVEEGGSVVLSFTATDEGALEYDWDLENNGSFETTDDQPTLSAANLDGPSFHYSRVRATDRAGRTAISIAEVVVINAAPTVAIDGVPASVTEGTAIQLSGSATDPSTADTISSYAWLVKKNGVDYTSGTGADFNFTPDDNGSYEVSLSVTDDDGGVGTASQTITVDNVAPTAAFTGAPASSSEGTAISLSGSATDPGIFDTFAYAWTVKKDGSNYKTGSGASYSFTPDDNGSYEVSLKVTDKDGGTGTASQTITVDNVAPTLSNISLTSGTINEGGSVTLSGSIMDLGSADSFTLTVDWGDGSPASSTSLAAGKTSFEVSHTYADDDPTGTASDVIEIGLTLTDDDGGEATDRTSVTVNNLAPSLTISSPDNGSLYAINTTVDLSASVTDAGTKDTLTCSVNWADGSTSSGTMSADSCSASHIYTAAGVYSLQMEAEDDDTGTASQRLMVVVYDPSAGFVTGGGWINSQAGAYINNPTLTGKATFGFVSKYQKGASIPTGTTAFQFDIAGLSFSSTAYEWLVVNQAGTNAQFKGSGLINGLPDTNGNPYKFQLWAGDGSPDTFRIKIWYETGDVETVVYDNGIDQAIGAGNIVVHTSK